MATLATIISTIEDLSNNGTGTSTDTARIMRYINNTYTEVYREIAESYQSALVTTQTGALSSGVITLSATPFSVISVKDTDNNTELQPKTILEMDEIADNLALVGNPKYYYQTSPTNITTYPVSNKNVRVRYVPQVNTLTDSSVETDIKFPAEFHDILIWGALRYVAYDERDKGFGQEVGYAAQQYDRTHRMLMDWMLTSQTREPVRTVPVLA